MHAAKKRFALPLALLCAASALLLYGDGGANHQVFATRPIPCGVSGGNINLRGAAFCCGGTIGALVEDTTAQYLLSNNHIFARTNTGATGEGIIQPGLIDESPVCFQDANDAVANLSAFVPINFKARSTNSVDAAIAQVQAGKVDESGTILDIGQVAAGDGIEATVGMAVAKSGRTTGFTQGAVAGVNATVDVLYAGQQCGRSESGLARFVNQIVIQGAGFSAGGDSGSLIVQDPAASDCPRAVGLLFAGSSTTTIANRIADVQSAFGVTMVGKRCRPGGPSAGTSESAAQRAADPERRRQIAAIAVATDVKERFSARLFGVEGVVGHGVGLVEGDPETAVIQVYVVRDSPKLRRSLPSELEGVPVKVVETGTIVAY